MRTSPIRHLLAVLAASTVALGATPVAASGPVALYYGARCSKQTSCRQAAWTDTRSRRVFGVDPGIRCSQPGATLTFSAVRPAKVRRGGRFVLRLKTESRDAAGAVVSGRAKVTGTLRKKRRLTARWVAERTVPACSGRRAGRLTLRYRGPLAGV